MFRVVSKNTINKIDFSSFYDYLNTNSHDAFRFLSNSYVQEKLKKIYLEGGSVDLNDELKSLINTHLITRKGNPDNISIKVDYISTNKGDFYYFYLKSCDFESAMWTYNHVILNSIYYYFKSRKMLSMEVQKELRSNKDFALSLTKFNDLYHAIYYDNLLTSADYNDENLDALFNEVLTLIKSSDNDEFNLNKIENTPLFVELEKTGRDTISVGIECEALSSIVPYFYLSGISFFRGLANAIVVDDLLIDGKIDIKGFSKVLGSKGVFNCISFSLGNYIFKPSSSRSNTYTLYKPDYKSLQLDENIDYSNVSPFISTNGFIYKDYTRSLALLENMNKELSFPDIRYLEVITHEKLSDVTLNDITFVESDTDDGIGAYKVSFSSSKITDELAEKFVELTKINDETYALDSIIPVGNIILI